MLAHKEDGRDFEIAAVTAHNALVIYSSSTGTESTFHNECNCILYPLPLINHSDSLLTIQTLRENTLVLN